MYTVSPHVAPRRRAVILVLFCLNPAILFDAAVWRQIDYLDMNAMNIRFFLFGTNPGWSDTTMSLGSVDYKLVGLALLLLAVLYAVYYLWFSAAGPVEALLKTATFVSFSFYMLPTEIHERYIVMGLVLCLYAALHDPKWTLLSVGLTLTAFWNLWAVNYGDVIRAAEMWMVYLNGVVWVAMVLLMFNGRRPQGVSIRATETVARPG